MSRRAAAAWLAIVAVVLGGLFVVERQGVPPGLWTARIETVAVGDRSLRLVVTSQRSRGLVGLAGLDRLDGMLFAFPGPVAAGAGMTMKGMTFPIDAAFFDPDGRLIETLTLPLCDDPCPIHRPAAPFSYVIEAPAGNLAWLAPGDLLVPPP